MGSVTLMANPHTVLIKLLSLSLPKNIRILENGGEVMSIAKWLVSYGGCKNYSEAYKKLRNEESGVINTTFVIEEEKPIRYISQEILNQAPTQTDNLFIFLSGII